MLERERTFLQALRQRLAFHAFHDQIVDAVLMADVVQYTDVRMIQTGDGFGFTLEALLVGGIGRKTRRKNLDRHHAFQPSIPRAINFAHAARAQRPDNLIRTKPVPSR